MVSKEIIGGPDTQSTESFRDVEFDKRKRGSISHTARLYARQMISELPSGANARDPAPHGVEAAHRVRTVKRLFDRVVDGSDASVFLEIGCHHAQASHAFVSTGPTGRRAHAFEAIPYVYEQAVAAKKTEAVQFYNMAIGAENGTAKFNVPKERTRAIWGSLKERVDVQFETDEILVPMLTLNAAADMVGAVGSGRNAALWIDVEGAAFDVLNSGRLFLRDHVLALYIELYDEPIYADMNSSLEVLDLLLDVGFVPVARDNQFSKGYNMVAVHEDVYSACFGEISRFYLDAKKPVRIKGAASPNPSMS